MNYKYGDIAYKKRIQLSIRHILFIQLLILFILF